MHLTRLCITAAAATAAGFLAGFAAGAGLMAVRSGEDPTLIAAGAGMAAEKTTSRSIGKRSRESEHSPR
jgi:hypothetical protein